MTDTLELAAEPSPDPAARPRARARLRGRGPLVLLGLGVVLPAIGLWNPFNLVLVDLAFRHPWAGVMAVLVALTWLWLRHAPRSWIGGVGMVVLTLAIAIWLLAGVFFALFGLDETQPVEHLVAGPGHHVQAEMRTTRGLSDSWRLSLYSERGIWSRQQSLQRIDYVACADSCSRPDLDVEFTAADELSVYWDEELVYRVGFDPHSLRIRDQMCRVVERRTDGAKRDAVGCYDRPTGFWGWFSDA